MKPEDQAKSIAAKLSKLSRTLGVPYQVVATELLIERLLARIVSNPRLSKCLVFKGGYVGLRVYDSDRYTIDLDALLVKTNVKPTMNLVKEAAALNLKDGTWFEFQEQFDLKTQGEYGGIRQVYRAGIGPKLEDIRRAQLIHFDLGIGDPVIPGPLTVKTKELIGTAEISWSVYPLETMVAEKLQTLVSRGSDNSRAKDIFDLYSFLPRAKKSSLKKAIKACFQYRETPIPKDWIKTLKAMDLTLLKRGWQNAMAHVETRPEFEESFDGIISQLMRIFPKKDQK